MVALLERAFGVDQHVRDVLDVADFLIAATHLEQRIVGGRARIGRIEVEAVREKLPPPGGDREVLALDVMDDGGPGPGQQRRNNEADALARAGRRECHDVLRPVVAQVVLVGATKKDAGCVQQARTLQVTRARPAGRTVGGDELGLPGSPDRADDGGERSGDAARGRHEGAALEDVRRIGIELEPPQEELPGLVERHAVQHGPGAAELGLVAKRRRRPLRRQHQGERHDAEHDGDLTEKNLGRAHPTASRLRDHVLRTARLRRGLMSEMASVKDCASLCSDALNPKTCSVETRINRAYAGWKERSWKFRSDAAAPRDQTPMPRRRERY